MKIVTQFPLIMLYFICTDKKDPWFKHSRPIVLNGLSYGIVRLFDSFVPR